MDSVYAQVILGSMVGAMMPCLPDSGGMVSDESGLRLDTSTVHASWPSAEPSE